ncbi:MAG: hypothetical protein Q9223_001482 [Gallowayella weberi]
MGRAGAYDAEEDKYRRRGRRDDEPEDYEEEDQPVYEHEEPRRRGKAGAMRKPQRAYSDEEAEEEESEDDDRRHKQLVVRKKSKKGKSSGKQVARKKRQESSDRRREAQEEEKPKKKRKGKSHKKETVEVLKWEPVSIKDVDPEFLKLVLYELGVVPKKLEKGIEKGLLVRDTQTGEYNIDRFFEKGILSASDKKSWKKLLAQNKNDPRLIHSTHTGRGGPSRRMAPTVVLMDTRPYGPPQGHTRFNPMCEECLDCGGPCFYGFGGYD